MVLTIIEIADLVSQLKLACAAAECVADTMSAENPDCYSQLGLQFIVNQMNSIIDEIKSEVEAALKPYRG